MIRILTIIIFMIIIDWCQAIGFIVDYATDVKALIKVRLVDWHNASTYKNSISHSWDASISGASDSGIAAGVHWHRNTAYDSGNDTAIMREASVYRDQTIVCFACFECTTTRDLHFCWVMGGSIGASYHFGLRFAKAPVAHNHLSSDCIQCQSLPGVFRR